MIKRKVDPETYAKMGRPDLGKKMYFRKGGKKIYGVCSLVAFQGFKGARQGLILVGMCPYEKRANAILN